MNSITRLLASAVLALASLAAIAQPSPAMMQRVRTLVNAVNAGAETFETFARDNFTAAYLAAQTPEQRKALIEKINRELGKADGVSLEREGPNRVAIELEGRGKRAQLVFEYEADTYKISRLEFGEAAVPPDAAPDAPVRGDMSSAELNASLDRFLKTLAGEGKLSGVLLVARDGQPLFENGYNLANRSDDIANTPTTRFQLGSINKAFTRVAIGQLAAAGKLKLADTIGQHLPDYPNADAKRVTIEQLLTHRGGLANFFSPDFARKSKGQFRSNRDMYDYVAPKPLDFEPGSREAYCNSCYVVLGEIIARVSGTPYESYIERNVFEPAGMKTAGFFQTDEIRPNVATHYTATPNGLRSIIHTHSAGGNGAGGAWATAADLLAFDNAARAGKLLDPQWTAWFFRMPAPATGRVAADYSIAGGSSGINAALLGNGTWTVAAVSNFDERFMENLAMSVMRALNTKVTELTAVEPYLQQLEKNDGFSGAVLIARDGKPLFAKGYGLANRADNVPATPETRFNVGSINKQFTKVAISQLAAAGKLALDDPIGKHLADHPNEAAKKATIEQLLTHRGGLPNWMDDKEFAAASKTLFRANRDFYRFVAPKPLEFEPGAREQYCNSCYVVLGEIIERLSGMPYERYIEQNVLARAGMKTAGLFQTDDPVPQVAIGYARRESGLRSNFHMRGAGPNAAGGAFATTADLLAFEQAMRAGTLGIAKATGPLNFAGGGDGVSSMLLSNGTWTVVAMANLDSPAGSSVARALFQALTK